MLSPTEKKRRAAHAAISYVKDGMLLGLGTGKAATAFIHVLGERVKAGLNEIQRAHDIVARVAKADVGSVK